MSEIFYAISHLPDEKLFGLKECYTSKEIAINNYCEYIDKLEKSQNKELYPYNCFMYETNMEGNILGSFAITIMDDKSITESTFIAESENLNRQKIIDDVKAALEKEELKAHISANGEWGLKQFLDGAKCICLGSFNKETYNKAYDIIKGNIPEGYTVSKDNYFTIFINTKGSNNESAELLEESTDNECQAIYDKYANYIKWCRMDASEYCYVSSIGPKCTDKGTLFACAELNEESAQKVLKNFNDNNNISLDSDHFTVSVTMDMNENGVYSYYANKKSETKEFYKALKKELNNPDDSNETIEESFKNIIPVMKNLRINAMQTGNYVAIRPNLLKMIDNCKTVEEVNTFLKDARTGIKQLTDFANQFIEYPKRLKEIEKELKNNPNDYRLKNEKVKIENFLKQYKNNSYDKVMDHIKWCNTEYIPYIIKRKKELKTLNESTDLKIIYDLNTREEPLIQESAIINETKEFPVDFDEQGNLIIKNYKKLNFEAEYSASHKLLKIYNDSMNIEGMKYELSKLWFMNAVLEKRIYSNPTEAQLVAYSKVRARILNDFNTYLKVVLKEESNFNFTKYYNDSPFSDVKIKISGTLIGGLADLLKQVL